MKNSTATATMNLMLFGLESKTEHIYVVQPDYWHGNNLMY